MQEERGRHYAVNEILVRLLHSIVLKPSGLMRRDGKRPDGMSRRMTLVSWSAGRSLIWDFTCPARSGGAAGKQSSFICTRYV